MPEWWVVTGTEQTLVSGDVVVTLLREVEGEGEVGVCMCVFVGVCGGRVTVSLDLLLAFRVYWFKCLCLNDQLGQ